MRLIVCLVGLVTMCGFASGVEAEEGNFWGEYAPHSSSSFLDPPPRPSSSFSRPNPNAGYPGADLPPSDYQRDFDPEYGREAYLTPLDAGQYSGRTTVQTSEGTLECAAADYQGRIVCR